MKDPLIRYARAGYAGLFLCTPEETRAEAEVKAAAEELHRPLHAWSLTTGFIDTTSGSVRDCPDPVEALAQIDSLEGDCLVLLRDFGQLLEDKDPLLTRKLRDTLSRAKADGKVLILLGVWKPLPDELAREITRIDLELPGSEQLGNVLDGILESAGIEALGTATREASLSAAGGLTTMEAENAFALSVVEANAITPCDRRPRESPCIEEEWVARSHRQHRNSRCHRRTRRAQGLLTATTRSLHPTRPRLRPTDPQRHARARRSRLRQKPDCQSHRQRVRHSAAQA